MAKEVLLYDYMYSFSIMEFIQAMEEAKDEDIVVRLNNYGGNVDAGWSAIAKFSEHSKSKKIKVDGIAASMGAMFLVYADSAECLDVSDFMFHRAAYTDYYEKNYMTEEERQSLIKMNSKLKAAMEAKIGAEKWEKVTGTTLDRLFSMEEERIDIYLDAKQAKKLGLVQTINAITPEKKAEIGAKMRVAASLGNSTLNHKPTQSKEKESKNSNTNKMTIEKIKAEHPELYNQIVQAGVNQERERVGAWMAFVDIDKEAVTAGISEGKDLGQKVMAEMTVKGIKAQSLSKIEEQNADDQETSELENTPEAKAEAAKKAKASASFEKDVLTELGIKTAE